MDNSNAIFEKARELGELIKESDIKKKADETSHALLADKEATALIDGYNTIREKKMSEFEGKQPTSDDINEVNTYIQAEFEKIAQNPVIRDYLEAAKNYESLLGRMDAILKHFIVGEHDSEGCGGSCSTCGGCH